MTNASPVRELSAAVAVQAPSGFALAFLATYVREMGGTEGSSVLPMRYTVTQLAGLTLERDVTVHVRYRPEHGDQPAEVDIAWEPDASLFPRFSGTLHGEPNGEHACTLKLGGTYDVPGGMAGQLFDAVLGVRIAHATIEELLEKFRVAIEADYKQRMEYS